MKGLNWGSVVSVEASGSINRAPIWKARKRVHFAASRPRRMELPLTGMGNPREGPGVGETLRRSVLVFFDQQWRC